MTIETVRWAHSTCPHDCPSTCALEVEVLDSKTIGRVRGRKGHAYTDGVICGKVSRYADRVNHPQRLMHPLKRVGPKGVGMESFTPISWEQALDETAAAFKGAAQEFGSESVWPYFYAGTMGHVQRDGIERLRHEMRYSGQHSTFCVTLADAGWNAGTGRKRGTAGCEIADCELLVVWGGNPVNTQINVMHKFQQARRSRNAKLVVIDPYCTDTADKADLFLNLRPGTDGALACAVMHVLFEEDYADWDYLERFTDCPTELREHLKSRDPQWASERTGIPVSQILEFARLYGSTRQAFIRIGYGFTRSRNGATAMHSVSSLPAVTGAWKYRGGGALYGNTELYRLDKTMICGLDLIDPKIRILDQSRIGAVLCGDAADLGEGPPVKSMLIQNTNPMMVAPDTNKVRQGFMREDLFVCVHEQFMTETAAMADIVLPATSFLEHDDYYTASGHTYLQISPAVIEAPGECRSNHEVLQQLGQRLGAKHPGFQMSSWELMMRTLEDSGFEEGHNLERRSFEIDFEPG
ncbi:MAG TPA: molybdopterin-dependent oxidoreductase, partial [SAR324 cluster bacterium]|nr:molybdopterin-dependent oxidoreductase [SAR324 cluster bacterium]